LLGELAMTHVIPASVKYLNELIDSLAKLKNLGIDADTAAMEESVIEMTSHISSIKKNVRLMIEERKKANVLEEVRDKAIAYCDNVKPYFETIRYNADKLELLVDDNFWQLPKYRELLFLR
jgi:glutamine synthetase